MQHASLHMPTSAVPSESFDRKTFAEEHHVDECNKNMDGVRCCVSPEFLYPGTRKDVLQHFVSNYTSIEIQDSWSMVVSLSTVPVPRLFPIQFQ